MNQVIQISMFPWITFTPFTCMLVLVTQLLEMQQSTNNIIFGFFIGGLSEKLAVELRKLQHNKRFKRTRTRFGSLILNSRLAA